MFKRMLGDNPTKVASLIVRLSKIFDDIFIQDGP